MEVNSHEDSVGEFCCVGAILSMKLLIFVSKAIKLLLTELVSQCKNILPLAFSAFTSLQSRGEGFCTQLLSWGGGGFLFPSSRVPREDDYG